MVMINCIFCLWQFPIRTIESPRFSTDMLRTNGTIQASDSLLLSPLQLNSPVIEMPHSPFPSLNVDIHFHRLQIAIKYSKKWVSYQSSSR